MTAPKKRQIKIDFDRVNKTFKLTVPLLHAPKEIPSSIQTYLTSTKGMHFRPHQTTYRQEGGQVHLDQEIPFHQLSAMRNQILEFWQLARYCHKILLDLVE